MCKEYDQILRMYQYKNKGRGEKADGKIIDAARRQRKRITDKARYEREGDAIRAYQKFLYHQKRKDNER